ncbi:MAG: PilX N-terminal domain-containing pilus assembly protein, partial [Syntrophales bacterium]|nr:PilX N-terminal domain-containing pilus assembly protein [Syntrophales bacterium]
IPPFSKGGLGGFSDEKGMVLVVGLLLIVVLMLLGTTAVLTSTTDIRISANYKTSNRALYAAEAGIEEARARLRTNDPADSNEIADSHPTNTGWAAYIDIGDASKSQGKGYNSGNSMHLRVSSLQSTLDYTVKTVHQTNASGNILYWGDSNSDGINERNPTTGQNIYLATSYGTAAGANKTIKVEIARLPPITAPAALYVEAATIVQGASTYISGTDAPACGTSNLPGVATSLSAGTVTPTGNPTVTGSTSSTWSVTGGATNMDVQAMIDNWKGSANFTYNLTSNDTQSGMNWGTPVVGNQNDPSACSVSNIVHYNMNGMEIKLAGGSSGCGILLVEGNLELNGGFNWYGLIIVSGSVTIAGGGNKNITGSVIAGGSTQADLVGGNSSIVYCSAAISDQTTNRALRILSWKEE